MSYEAVKSEFVDCFLKRMSFVPQVSDFDSETIIYQHTKLARLFISFKRNTTLDWHWLAEKIGLMKDFLISKEEIAFNLSVAAKQCGVKIDPNFLW